MDYKKKYLKYKKKYVSLKNNQIGGNRIRLVSKGKVRDLLISAIQSAKSTFSTNNSSIFHYSADWAYQYFTDGYEFLNLNMKMMNRLILESEPMQNDASYNAKISLIQNVKNLVYSYLHCFEKRFSKNHILHHLRVNDYGDIKLNQLELLADLIGNANEYQNWECYDEVEDSSGPLGPYGPPGPSINNNSPVKGCMDINAINYNPRATINDVCIYSPISPRSPNFPPPGSPNFPPPRSPNFPPPGSPGSPSNPVQAVPITPLQNTTTKIITMFYDMYNEDNAYIPSPKIVQIKKKSKKKKSKNKSKKKSSKKKSTKKKSKKKSIKKKSVKKKSKKKSIKKKSTKKKSKKK